VTHGLPTHHSDNDVPMVRVTGVSRVYDTESESVWAVRDVSLEVDAGSFVCLFGSSGSGKSTLLNMMAGLDLPTTGSIRVLGQALESLNEDARARIRLHDVGVVFQDHHLIDEFTALENVMLPLEARGLPVAQARSEALHQLELVGLSGLHDRTPSKLSGGQRQRVGIARALIGGRRLLLADEPTGSLDSANSSSIFALLRQLCDQGATVVLATHEAASRQFADAVFEMQDGHLTTTRVG
jgi:ABC-type lipoprotein export system ATPase subunit